MVSLGDLIVRLIRIMTQKQMKLDGVGFEFRDMEFGTGQEKLHVWTEEFGLLLGKGEQLDIKFRSSEVFRKLPFPAFGISMGIKLLSCICV